MTHSIKDGEIALLFWDSAHYPAPCYACGPLMIMDVQENPKPEEASRKKWTLTNRRNKDMYE